MDEESSQGKGINFLAEVCNLQLVAEPDLAHQKWNAFKRCMKWSNFTLPMMKLTILCS